LTATTASLRTLPSDCVGPQAVIAALQRGSHNFCRRPDVNSLWRARCAARGRGFCAPRCYAARYIRASRTQELQFRVDDQHEIGQDAGLRKEECRGRPWEMLAGNA
jgi:hypothetical protein